MDREKIREDRRKRRKLKRLKEQQKRLKTDIQVEFLKVSY
jgi:hypothetical protein